MRQQLKLTVVIILGIALGVGGCTTTSRLWTGETSAGVVLPMVEGSDRVLLMTRTGQELHCPVRAVDAGFVYGCRAPVALEEIQEVRLRRLDGESVLTLRDLRPGDQLTVYPRGGGVKQFSYVAHDGGVLRGEGVEIMLSEVERATVVRNPPKPGALKVLGVAVFTVMAAGSLFIYLMAKAQEGQPD